MTDREAVIRALTARMKAAAIRGDLVDAQNLEAYVSGLKDTTDAAYTELVDEREASDIA